MKTYKEMLEDSNKKILEHVATYPERYPHVRTVDQFFKIQNLIEEFERENAEADGWGGD